MEDVFIYSYLLPGGVLLFIFFLFLYAGLVVLGWVLFRRFGYLEELDRLEVWKKHILLVLFCLFHMVMPVGILWLLDNCYRLGLFVSFVCGIYFFYLLYFLSREE